LSAALGLFLLVMMVVLARIKEEKEYTLADKVLQWGYEVIV